MELSLEAYRTIVKNVQSRSDLAILCRVSRSFRRVAERALYNTLYMREVETTRKLCDALVGQPRVASWVEALTIAVEEGDREGGQGEGEREEEEDEEEYSETEDEEAADTNYRMDLAAALALSLKSSTGNGNENPDAPIASTSALPEPKPQGSLWPVIAQALQNMTRLRHLNILLNGSPTSSYSYSGDGNLGWILADCPFRLKSFHSDMKWDEDLVNFLNTQDKIEDLYIGDYDEGEEEQEGEGGYVEQIEEVPREGEGETTPRFRPRTTFATVPEPTTISTSGHRPVYGTGNTTPTPGSQPLTFFPSSRSRLSLRLSPSALPRLTTLECTFSEAAVAIVPSRPVSRLKTCFSRTDPVGKREEMKVLIEALGRASATVSVRSATSRSGSTTKGGKESRVIGGWRALDIADAEYQEEFAMELLRAIVNVSLVDPRSRPGSSGNLSMKTTLRYLGTLVLPVGGKEVSSMSIDAVNGQVNLLVVPLLIAFLYVIFAVYADTETFLTSFHTFLRSPSFQRLLFYGLLMQFRRLSCIELEVSAWNPSPATLGPVAFRALANELRLYCPGVSKVVFIAVGANDGNGNAGNGGSGSSDSSGFGIGERTTVEYVVGQGVGRVEREPLNGAGGSSEGLWRDL